MLPAEEGKYYFKLQIFFCFPSGAQKQDNFKKGLCFVEPGMIGHLGSGKQAESYRGSGLS